MSSLPLVINSQKEISKKKRKNEWNCLLPLKASFHNRCWWASLSSCSPATQISPLTVAKRDASSVLGRAERVRWDEKVQHQQVLLFLSLTFRADGRLPGTYTVYLDVFSLQAMLDQLLVTCICSLYLNSLLFYWHPIYWFIDLKSSSIVGVFS